MAVPNLLQQVTAEEYLTQERAAPYKSEYLDGYIIAMSGASRAHNLITGNVFRLLSNQLLDRPCEVYTGEMRVKVSARGMYTYPDIAVVRREPEFEDAHVDTLLNPAVIVEVLSPSTEGYDRGSKFGYYRGLPSLREYLLVAQDKPLVEHYVRDDGGWRLTEARDLAAEVALPAIGCTLPVADIYHRVPLPAPGSAAAAGPLDPSLDS